MNELLFRENINDIDILFDLCHVFTNHFISDFTFVRTFIEDEVIPVSFFNSSYIILI